MTSLSSDELKELAGKRRGECDNPRHKTVQDLVNREVICVDCGGIVLDIPTAALREQLGSAEERESTQLQNMPGKSGMKTRNGTQLFYASASEPGQIFRDCNPYGVRDYTKKRCGPIIDPNYSNVNTAYPIAKSFGRNGDWDQSGMKFIVNYERDSWYADSSIIRHQLCGKYNIDDLTEERLAKKDLKGYSVIVIDILPELITRLDIHMAPPGRMNRPDREENRAEAVGLLQQLAGILSKMLDKGDRIEDSEDGLLELEEDPYLEHNPKRRISLLAGGEGQIVDEDLDVGKI